MRAACLCRLPPRADMKGAAIITAMFVVALSALLVAGLLWRQQVQIRRLENQRLRLQAQWVERAAFDWARFILRSAAAASPVDYLGGVWALPIAPTKLSDLIGHFGGASGARTGEGQETILSGSIEDAQAKFNLRNLVDTSAPGRLQPNLVQIANFRRLLQLLGLRPALANAAAAQVRASLMRQRAVTSAAINTPGNAAGARAPAPSLPGVGGAVEVSIDADVQPLPMRSMRALLDAPGFTPASIARLRPFVTVLPLASKLNVNTARAEVIAAMIPGLELANAQSLVALRERAFFVNMGDFENRLRTFGASLRFDRRQFDVKTSLFLIHGQIHHERAALFREALILRSRQPEPQTLTISVHDAEFFKGELKR